MTHHEFSRLRRLSSPCTANSVTFGGHCFNCGYRNPTPPQLTIAEGYARGRQDKLARNSEDPYRWIKEWAPKGYEFYRGYTDGYADTPSPT